MGMVIVQNAYLNRALRFPEIRIFARADGTLWLIAKFDEQRYEIGEIVIEKDRFVVHVRTANLTETRAEGFTLTGLKLAVVKATEVLGNRDGSPTADTTPTGSSESHHESHSTV